MKAFGKKLTSKRRSKQQQGGSDGVVNDSPVINEEDPGTTSYVNEQRDHDSGTDVANHSASSHTKSFTSSNKNKKGFSARRSERIKTSDVSSDNDVWSEFLAVVEVLIPGKAGNIKNGEKRYELQIRSFFESALTGKREWDEPPSGATTIQYASDEARKMAEVQMEDLQVVATDNKMSNSNGASLAAFTEGENNNYEHTTATSTTTTSDENSPKRKSVSSKLSGAFRRISLRKSAKEKEPRARPNLQYKPDSKIDQLLEEQRKEQAELEQRDLRRALSQSRSSKMLHNHPSFSRQAEHCMSEKKPMDRNEARNRDRRRRSSIRMLEDHSEGLSSQAIRQLEIAAYQDDDDDDDGIVGFNYNESAEMSDLDKELLAAARHQNEVTSSSGVFTGRHYRSESTRNLSLEEQSEIDMAKALSLSLTSATETQTVPETETKASPIMHTRSMSLEEEDEQVMKNILEASRRESLRNSIKKDNIHIEMPPEPPRRLSLEEEEEMVVRNIMEASRREALLHSIKSQQAEVVDNEAEVGALETSLKTSNDDIKDDAKNVRDTPITTAETVTTAQAPPDSDTLTEEEKLKSQMENILKNSEEEKLNPSPKTPDRRKNDDTFMANMFQTNQDDSPSWTKMQQLSPDPRAKSTSDAEDKAFQAVLEESKNESAFAGGTGMAHGSKCDIPDEDDELSCRIVSRQSVFDSPMQIPMKGEK